MHIAIAGGGPAGLFAGIVLTDHGHDVEIFEQSHATGDIGAGIQISPNGTRLLAHHGLLDQIHVVAFEPQAATLRRADTGHTVFRTPLSTNISSSYGAPYFHLHRADLSDVLSTAGTERGVRIHTRTRVERFDNDATCPAVFFEDGTSQSFDLLIGADGIHSTIRQQLCGTDNARFTNHVAWRGLVPAARLPEHTIAPDATVWAGPGRHLVHYYVRGGNLINFVAVEERSSWTDENWHTPGDLTNVRRAFSDWSAEIDTLLGAADACALWGLFDRAPLDNWTDRNVCLLGDACHAMLPFMAQGAVMAFEDAVVLARSLEAHDSLPEALRAYERIRKPRTTAIQERARRNGRLFHERSALRRNLAFHPMSLADRLLPGLIAKQLDWIYGYDALTVDVTRIS